MRTQKHQAGKKECWMEGEGGGYRPVVVAKVHFIQVTVQIFLNVHTIETCHRCKMISLVHNGKFT